MPTWLTTYPDHSRRNAGATEFDSHMNFFLTAALGYLLGSIPFGFILVRIFRGQDVRKTGSGNIGATNVARSSPILGLMTLILDALKGQQAQLKRLLAQKMWISNAPKPRLLR